MVSTVITSSSPATRLAVSSIRREQPCGLAKPAQPAGSGCKAMRPACARASAASSRGNGAERAGSQPPARQHNPGATRRRRRRHQSQARRRHRVRRQAQRVGKFHDLDITRRRRSGRLGVERHDPVRPGQLREQPHQFRLHLERKRRRTRAQRRQESRELQACRPGHGSSAPARGVPSDRAHPRPSVDGNPAPGHRASPGRGRRAHGRSPPRPSDSHRGASPPSIPPAGHP